MASYGYIIIKTLITDIDPNAKVKEAMNHINAAKRDREAAIEEGEAEKIKIINGDHIRFVELKLEDQRRRDEEYQRRQAVRNNYENAFQEVVHRDVLPIIRDTLIETDDE